VAALSPKTQPKIYTPGVIQLLSKAKKILISTHLLPDGDGLGAEVALFHYLQKAGKDCRILNPDPLPKRFEFLDPEQDLLLPTATSQKPKIWKDWDLWIILDTHDPRRLGKQWNELSHRSKDILFLDHHPTPKGGYQIAYPENTRVISEINASSIGELLYALFNQTKWAPLDPKIALGLYVSVMTDTNSFRYAKTTPTAHRIAGEMIQYGINPEEVYQNIYSSKEVSHLKLLGILLQRVKVTQGGQIAWIEMSRRLRREYQASADETLSFLNLLLLIREAEVICFFREEDDGKTRVSLKSKGRVVVNQLAIELGGGGHDYAAGVSLPLSLTKTRTLVISKLKRIMKL
jgi:phosphoesterase RecJ-like protein